MARREASRLALRSLFQAALAMVACTALETAVRAQDRLSQYLTQYQNETNPVRKARLLGQLGPLEIDKARMTFKAGEDEQALAIITRYRDEVRITSDALTATGVDAVKRPAGFKELQIGLRVTVRRLDDLILTIPVDKRPWFRAVRSDLADSENKLIDALFPTAEKNSKKQQ